MSKIAFVTVMPEGIAVIRASDATVVWANDRLATMLGHRPGAAVGLQAPALDGGDPAAEIRTALESTGAWGGTLELPAGDGTAARCT